jgi:hypothetical protein
VKELSSKSLVGRPFCIEVCRYGSSCKRAHLSRLCNLINVCPKRVSSGRLGASYSAERYQSESSVDRAEVSSCAPLRCSANRTRATTIAMPGTNLRTLPYVQLSTIRMRYTVTCLTTRI